MKARDREQRERWLRDPETILADIQAAQIPKRRLGDPRPLWLVKAMDDGRVRAKAERKRKAFAEALARNVGRPERAKYRDIGNGIPYRVVRAMLPGEWYGLKALCRSIGIDASGAGAAKQKLLKRGWAERVPNPAWSTAQIDPLRIMGGEVREPQWLYRLTALGEVARRGEIKPKIARGRPPKGGRVKA